MKRIPNPKKFFTKDEEAKIVNAIKEAEKNTSGEIRVHLVKSVKENPIKSAIRVFNMLGMYKTKLRNGCLILIGLKDRKVAIIGDKGINDVVPEGFWDDAVKVITQGFFRGDYAAALAKAILMIGGKLKQYFPYQSDDVNELPDEISKG